MYIILWQNRQDKFSFKISPDRVLLSDLPFRSRRTRNSKSPSNYVHHPVFEDCNYYFLSDVKNSYISSFCTHNTSGKIEFNIKQKFVKFCTLLTEISISSQIALFYK